MTIFGLMAQGSTSSSMSGKITDLETREGLIATDIIATHVPSGTIYGAASDNSGFFRIPGMRVGGPYTIEVSYVGYETFTRNDVHLNLGQNLKLDAALSTASIGLEEIVISAGGLFDGTKTCLLYTSPSPRDRG